jgi:hypothetical protein
MTAVRRTVAVMLTAVAVGTLPAGAADPTKINEAIVKGGNYLLGVFARGGAGQGNHGLGQAALCGMAMLEAGVKPDDPALLAVTQVVRTAGVAQSGTYHISLAILFLDRLGDPRDIPLIQFLGVRLYGGLSGGGWTYSCGADLTPGEAAQWSAVLQKPFKPDDRKPNPKKPDSGFPAASGGPKTPEVSSKKLHPDVARYLGVVRAGPRGGGGLGGDNSNTQFGLIGLWVASRHGLPMDDAFATIEAHFLTSQNRADGGWGYMAADNKTTGAMTCAGLLGLAVGAARGKAKPEEPAEKKGGSDNPFDNPTKSGGGGSTGPKPSVPGATVEHRKAAIDAGLTAIGQLIKTSPPHGGTGDGPLANHIGHGDMYYLCWSIERVAVAFGLDTIGDQDWYTWGCGYLLPTQGQDGSFVGGKFGADVGAAGARGIR